MRKCHRCGEPWREKGIPGTREDCLKCGASLHVCANCRFFDNAALEWCREPMAREEKPLAFDKSNVCDWFVFLDPAEESLNAEKSKSARLALEAMFKPTAKGL
ncbi:MAG: hypothetical protein LBU64_13030 [Planctomycetota bacterium]|jgi:hypothetical protein|nr:hypothetical protein [Planctomycetota bacterium]